MPVLKDSGGRTEFETGAVRDLQGHKGRMDLFPLSVMSTLFEQRGQSVLAGIVANIDKFLYSLDTKYLVNAYFRFIDLRGWTLEESLIEVSKHYEDGAVKYGTHNWEKGIPLHSFIDSGVRHLDQWSMKDESDPHDRAFLWNMIGAIWTVEHRPEMIDTPMHKWDCKTPYTNFDYERACKRCRDANEVTDAASGYDPAAIAVPDGATAHTTTKRSGMQSESAGDSLSSTSDQPM